MADFSIGEMQEMQRILQEKYKRKWEPVDAATGRNLSGPYRTVKEAMAALDEE